MMMQKSQDLMCQIALVSPAVLYQYGPAFPDHIDQ